MSCLKSNDWKISEILPDIWKQTQFDFHESKIKSNLLPNEAYLIQRGNRFVNRGYKCTDFCALIVA